MKMLLDVSLKYILFQSKDQKRRGYNSSRKTGQQKLENGAYFIQKGFQEKLSLVTLPYQLLNLAPII